MNQKNIIPDKLPFEIWNNANKDLIILYALGRFGPLEREIFINSPDPYNSITNRMNKNTFHKWAKELMRKNYIEVSKQYRKSTYKITSSGLHELSVRLRKYKLDFQTLNKIEQKKIKTHIQQTIKFFEESKIEDNNVKVEFLELANDVSIDKFKRFSREIFNYNLLFIVLNHPKFYPNYTISIKDFIRQYNTYSKVKISETDINFFLQEAIKKKIYGITFYELILNSNEKVLYFRSNSEYGKIFKNIVESRLKNLYFFKNLGLIDITRQTLETVYREILSILIKKYKMFNSALKNPLISLLNDYIRDIREEIYKKIIFEISEFDKYISLIPPELIPLPHSAEFLSTDSLDDIEVNIKSITEEDYLKTQKEHLSKAKDLYYNKKNYKEALEEVNKYTKRKPDDVGAKKLKLFIFWDMKKFKEALEVNERIYELKPKNLYTLIDHAYWKALILFNMERYNDALEAFRVIDNVENIIELDNNELTNFFTEYYPGYQFEELRAKILYKLERYNEALKAINKDIEVMWNEAVYLPDSYELKSRILYKLEDFKEALNIIDKAIEWEMEMEKEHSNTTLDRRKISILLAMKNYQGVLDNLYEISEPDIFSFAIDQLFVNEQYELAQKAIERGFELDPEDNSGFFSDFEVYHKNDVIEYINKKYYDKALAKIDRLMKLYISAEFYEYKISALIGLKRYEDALEVVNEAIEKWPKHPKQIPWGLLEKEIDKTLTKDEEQKISYGYKFCQLKARILRNIGNYNDSLKILEKIIKENPNIPETYLLKGLNEYDLENLDKALQSIDTAINLNPNKELFYTIKADFLYRSYRYNDALLSINKSIELDPMNPDCYDLKAHILVFMNRHNAALKAINEGINKFPEFSKFYATKSFILSDDEKSLNALKKAENLGFDISYYNKAQLLLNLNRYEEALEAINIEIEESTDDPLPYELKVMILANLERFNDAIKTFDKVNKINPEYAKFSSVNHQLYNFMAYSFAKVKKKEKAIEAIKKAIELDLEESNYYDSYGEILMMFGNYEEAVIQLEKAKELRFTPIETYINLGKCYFELGQYKKALENLEIGIYQAEHRVKKIILTKDDKRVAQDFPQTELIKEAERYISEIKKLKY